MSWFDHAAWHNLCSEIALNPMPCCAREVIERLVDHGYYVAGLGGADEQVIFRLYDYGLVAPSQEEDEGLAHAFPEEVYRWRPEPMLREAVVRGCIGDLC